MFSIFHYCIIIFFPHDVYVQAAQSQYPCLLSRCWSPEEYWKMTYLLDDAALIANLALTHSGIKGDIISLLLKISLIQAPLLKPRVNRRSRPLVWHTDVLWELIYEQRWKYAQFDSVESLPPCHSFIQRCCLPTCFHPLLSCRPVFAISRVSGKQVGDWYRTFSGLVFKMYVRIWACQKWENVFGI